jgi:hypothetical protein
LKEIGRLLINSNIIIIFIFNYCSLIIRGNENENAFCCSNSKTYSFKVAEISNPLLITSNIGTYNQKTEDMSTERELKPCQVKHFIFINL